MKQLSDSTFLVGGAVRDILLGIEPKDKDYVVVGKTEQEMLSLGFEKVGADFPVFINPQNGFEYALARTERKNGIGYNGFLVNTENVTLEQDLFRRDLTINSMAFDKDGNLIDPYNGKNDLENKILRHVSNHFAEDPVRILRIARFSARYNFKIAKDTIELMKSMVQNGEFDNLTKERVWKEFEKVSNEPFITNFFSSLIEVGALNKLIGFNDSFDLSFLSHLEKLNNKNETLIFCGIFSQLEHNELSQWKIPSAIKKEIALFKNWKEEPLIYSSLSSEDKVKFINSTKAIHDIHKSSDFLINILTYSNWKFDNNKSIDDELVALNKDVDNLKSIDYNSIIENAKMNNEKPSDAILNTQINNLQKKIGVKIR